MGWRALPENRVLVVDVLGSASQLADQPLHAVIRGDDIGVDVGDACTQAVNSIRFTFALYTWAEEKELCIVDWRLIDVMLNVPSTPSKSRRLRPRANGLNRARPPMATKGTATAAAMPARLKPTSETAFWMELH